MSLDFTRARRRQRSAGERSIVALGEDAIERKRVKVRAEIEGRAEALDDGDRAASTEAESWPRA
jgi:hypothetical protein